MDDIAAATTPNELELLRAAVRTEFGRDRRFSLLERMVAAKRRVLHAAQALEEEVRRANHELAEDIEASGRGGGRLTPGNAVVGARSQTPPNSSC